MVEYWYTIRQVFAGMDILKEYWVEHPGALIQLGMCALGFAVAYLFSRLVRYKLAPWFIRRAHQARGRLWRVLAEGFSKPAPVFVWALGLYAALIFLPLPPAWQEVYMPWLNKMLRITLICLFAWGLIGSSDIGPILVKNVQGKLDMEMDRTVASFVNKILKIVVAAFAVVMVLGEMGFNVNGLLTGLGLAGLTISLAAKESASNLFSGLVLVLEKPFALDDWISVDGVEGNVEDIGFRSTKIRTLDGSLVVVPNSQLCSICITNASQRQKRIFRFTLGITYDTPRPKLEALIEALRALLAAHPKTEPGSVLVYLKGFGASSIDILVHCYVQVASTDEFLPIQEELNLQIMGLMQQQGVEFAFPSQTLYLQQP